MSNTRGHTGRRDRPGTGSKAWEDGPDPELASWVEDSISLAASIARMIAGAYDSVDS